MRKRGFLLVVAVLLWCTNLQALSAKAVGSETRTCIEDDACFYSTVDNSVCSSDSATVLIGGDNVEKAYLYYTQKGLSPVQSAAIVGNYVVESGVNPNNPQKNGPGRGIAQWSAGGRWDVLLQFAKEQGRDPLDLGLQLDFSWQELNGSYKKVLDKLKTLTDIIEATDWVEAQYEAAGNPSLKLREKAASEILAQYGGGAAAATSTATTTSNPCGLLATGQNTQYIDGFTVFSQYDSAWGSKPYGSSTIAKSGCGPSAMAMIITALKGTQVTPLETATYAGSRGLYVEGSGSSWTIAPVLAEHYGLQSQAIGASVPAIAAALQAGKLVIGSGRGSLPFTTGGHYIVIRGVTASGKFKVGDSAHQNTSAQEWDAQALVSQMNGGSVYAISK